MSSPAAELAFNNYRLRTNNCKKRPIPQAEGGQVQRGLARTLAGCRREILPPNFGLFFEQKRGIYPLF